MNRRFLVVLSTARSLLTFPVLCERVGSRPKFQSGRSIVVLADICLPHVFACKLKSWQYLSKSINLTSQAERLLDLKNIKKPCPFLMIEVIFELDYGLVSIKGVYSKPLLHEAATSALLAASVLRDVANEDEFFSFPTSKHEKLAEASSDETLYRD